MPSIVAPQFLDTLWKNAQSNPELRAVEDMVGYLPNEALNLVNTVPVTAGALTDLVSFLRTDFDTFFLTLENVTNGTNNRQFSFQVHSGGSYQAASYITCMTLNTAGTITGTTLTTGFPLGPTQPNSSPGLSGSLYIANPAQATARKMIWAETATITNTPSAVTATTVGYWNGGNGAVDGWQIVPSGGSINSGTVRVYGIRNT